MSWKNKRNVFIGPHQGCPKTWFLTFFNLFSWHQGFLQMFMNWSAAEGLFCTLNHAKLLKQQKKQRSKDVHFFSRHLRLEMLTQILNVALNDPCISDLKCEELHWLNKLKELLFYWVQGRAENKNTEPEKLEIINNDYTLNVSLLKLYFSSWPSLSSLCGCRIPEVIVCVISATSLWNQHRVVAVNHLNWTWCDGFCIDCNYVPLPTSSNVLAVILRLYFCWCLGRWGDVIQSWVIVRQFHQAC